MAEDAAGAGGATGSSAGTGPVILKNGQIIQNYEIVKPLGKGKFSIVYMAKRLTDGTMCALKKINIFDMMVPKQREKCLKEVRLLQSLDHPNIVKLKDSFIDNNELLIIVEWAEKGDLKRLIRRALSMDVHFKEAEIWEYSRQLASALDHMHQKRIMHRDLKPANIFVTIEGSLKLGDLGLGRFFSSQTLEAFSKVGTPLYMSPEVLRGAGYDMRSDVWSLGCVLYELAMLRSPFKSEQQLSLYDLFVRISKGEYPPLPETVSPEFRELIGWMLALDPEKRFHCVQALDICTARVAALTAHLPQKEEPGVHKAKDPTASSRVSRPSPLLVMDDIVEKLKLLECEEQFLRPRGFPILHRCFFAFAQKVIAPRQVTQFEIMYELIRWLLGQVSRREAKGQKEMLEREGAADASAGPPCSMASKGVSSSSTAGTVAEADAGAGDAAAGPGSAKASCSRSKGDSDTLIREVVAELAVRGIQISAEATLAQLQQGYGEGVCLILNELINQELVGRDFHFENPAWGEAPAGDGVPPDEVDEEVMDSESEGSEKNAESSSEEFGNELSLGRIETGFMERGQGSSAIPSSLEQVHESNVDPEAWKAEVERVRPHLKMSADLLGPLGGWQGTLSQTRELCMRVDEIVQPGLLPDRIYGCCRQWRRDLDELRCHEDRLNARFSKRATETAQLRAESATETEAIATLQASVTTLSGQLGTVTEELEKQKSEVAGQSEVALDTEKLPNLRKAIQSLRDESRQLELRIGCVQFELTGQQLCRMPSDKRREHAVGDQPVWSGQDADNS